MTLTCPVCGKEFKTSNSRKKFCTYGCCLEAQRRKSEEKYLSLKKSGICVYCKTNAAVPGEIACNSCRQYHAKAHRLRYVKKRGKKDEEI